MVTPLEISVPDFCDDNDLSLFEQALKLSEEEGEVAEAVLGLEGELLFKDGFTEDDLEYELAQVIHTAYTVGHLAGIDVSDVKTRTREVGAENLER